MPSTLVGLEMSESPITLKILGRQGTRPRLLYNLYRTETHTELTEEFHVDDFDELPALQESGVLPRVTHLIISRGALEGTWPERVNNSVCQVFAEARNLQKLTWIGIPLAAETLETLRRCCRRIKSIYVDFPENMEEMVLGLSIAGDELEDDESDEDALAARALYRAPSFLGFPEIESLHVYNIFDDLRHFREDIVKVIRKAPTLRSLGLSLAIGSIARCYNSGHVGQYNGWFDRLCGEYARSGAPRLQLGSLICGTAVYPTRADSLSNFIDLTCLEQVHVENRSVSREGTYISLYDSSEHSGIAFTSFLSNQSRHLRRFSAFQFRDDILEAFGGINDPNVTRQLALSFEDQDYVEIHDLFQQDENYPHFPLPLRMVDLDLQRREWEQLKAGDILNSLVTSQQDTLQGLMVHLPEEAATDEGFAHLDILGQALGSLPNLDQLVIGMDKFGRARSKLNNEQLRQCAKLLVMVAPQIRFINIYWMFWKVFRVSNATGTEVVLLKELSLAKREQVELWTIERFISRSEFWLTVPGDQRYHFWEMDSPNESYSCTAEELVLYSQANCLAKANPDPDSSDISDFLTQLQADRVKYRETQAQGPELAGLLGKYLLWIDHLFFLDIIFRQRKRESMPDIPDLITPQFHGQLEIPDGTLNGVFIKETGQLMINLEETSFDAVFCVIVHELCHVYLHLLVKDHDASRYFRQVENNGGHGIEFHNLLQSIYGQLFEWLPDWSELELLSWDHQRLLEASLAEPAISESAARSLIYANLHNL
ncbi:hypothetical protein NPX13_g3265 [Xylaria arbuscula]|uniref:Uncharacterized protein n=1 Tax=Xylaria arbuscula TaxID=114810 RepID=A0A9W8NIS8_9PEZI|nr:hypothetical protein NPX13_g3265 [Xylaria arbuscula]